MSKSTTERRQNFERLVNEAEFLIISHPKKYRYKVAGLAVLGYLFIFGLLAVLIALTVGGFWLAIAYNSVILLLIKSKLIILFPVLIWVILKALWVKFSPPIGYVLSRKEFPALFADLDPLCRQLQTAKIHQVLLTDEFNAAISQNPRLGIFGWHKNTLILGLPLLLAFSREQAQAVLAHELGHLSGNHSRFNAWIYRVRETWYQIANAVGENAFLIGKFFSWYAPYFNAYSFALARANEYEADAVAAKLTSAKALAEGLVVVRIYGTLQSSHYWQPFFDSTQDIISQSPYQGLAHFFSHPSVSAEEIQSHIKQVYTINTNHSDTHPAMKDRLAALKVAPEILQPVTQNAAQTWFGAAYQKVLDDFDQEWMSCNGLDLKERALNRQKMRAELEELQAIAAEESSTEQQLRIAGLVTYLQSETAGLELYQAYLQQHPDDLDVQLYVGKIKLQHHDETGLEHLNRAMERFLLILPVCEAAYHYYEALGDKEKILYWQERAEAQYDLQNQAHAERSVVSPSDMLMACPLSAEILEELRQQLQQIKGIKHAWICNKQLAIVPDESPVSVLAYQSGWFAKEAKLTQQIIDSVTFQNTTFVVMKGGSAKGVAKKAMKIGKALF